MSANQRLSSQERNQLVELRNAYETHYLGDRWPGLLTHRGFNGSPNMFSAACWNWALQASEGNINAATSAPQLYTHVGDIIVQGAKFGQERTELRRADLPGTYYLEFRRINLAWKAAKSGTDQHGRAVSAQRLRERRQAFLNAMMRYTLRKNGFSVANRAVRGGDKYVIAMVTKEDTWQSWDHWALKIFNDAGRHVYIQKEPNLPLSIGFDRLWEADRDGRIVGEVPVSGLHPAHVEVLRYELAHRDDE
ncbi:hypothetical protein NHH03_24680 [Stieleria sp. TO1_6]|uniref:hypothetical protein n=1 Tax=Stieleria tagensis TaxID=2956795 RepID=UPI00209B4288|nr:hypothetical protein [Stieleria tagensis]MCO8124956.1 hypothetical protein [Stieleria tagensis]